MKLDLVKSSARPFWQKARVKWNGKEAEVWARCNSRAERQGERIGGGFEDHFDSVEVNVRDEARFAGVALQSEYLEFLARGPDDFRESPPNFLTTAEFEALFK